MANVQGSRGRKAVVISAVMLMLAASVAAHAQTFEKLVDLTGPNGINPNFGPLVQGRDGNLYGTTAYGGLGFGTVFKMTPAGVLTTIYKFCATQNCADGSYPTAGLVLGMDGQFYGTTVSGGNSPKCFGGCGTVFKISSSGLLTTLYHFSLHPDGASPGAGLIQALDGNLYGSTSEGGPTSICKAFGGCGTVFRITPQGTLTTLHAFSNAEGNAPWAALVQGSDGDFYGSTIFGGRSGGYGAIFKITAGGVLTVLHSFDGLDGYEPYGALIQATDGNFYGTTLFDGAKGGGTVFKMTPDGSLTTLHNFNPRDSSEGNTPYAGLVQATDGNFYGTTFDGGTSSSCFGGCGTIFEITSDGLLTTLHSFELPDGGSHPVGGLVQATNGNFYGTTYGVKLGAGGGSTVYALSVGLGPFVKTVPAGGKVGSSVMILGSKLEGATSVSFNGTAATFKVMSNTLISATVPAGATTGPVQVVKPGGTVTSNVSFQVQ